MSSPSPSPTRFPTVIDSTILSAWKSCHQKAFLEYFLHYKPLSPSVHLHAGAAFAKGLEVAREAYFVQGLPETSSIERGLHALLMSYGGFECPDDSPKSLPRMLGALEFYFDQYPLARENAPPARLPSGGRAIEFSFSFPIDVLHPETGDPLLYVGRMDQICEYAGALYGEDDKTTSQLGASWAKQWDLRGQFTGYCWGARESGFPLKGFLIRGISILKTKYETQQAITYRPEWMIDRWYEGMCREVEAMITAWRTGVWSFNEADSCGSYGGCIFRQCCQSQDPSPWLSTNFERRVWDPVKREEAVLPHPEAA